MAKHDQQNNGVQQTTLSKTKKNERNVDKGLGNKRFNLLANKLNKTFKTERPEIKFKPNSTEMTKMP